MRRGSRTMVVCVPGAPLVFSSARLSLFSRPAALLTASRSSCLALSLYPHKNGLVNGYGQNQVILPGTEEVANDKRRKGGPHARMNGKRIAIGRGTT